LDALDPNDLRRLYQDAIDIYWDPDTYNRSLRLEAEESELLGLVGERLPEVRRIWEEGEEE
jgi:hypothetical protein